ncbi:arad-like aldolase/epimerase [Mycena rebaudengoi]|nr:arad-like aldolase/epimerase [Mycena rebaudengoi]
MLYNPFLLGLLLSYLQPFTLAQDVPTSVVQAGIDLLDANHILHFLDVVDAFGHISVRNPANASQFLMTFAIAPAQATSQSIVTYEIDNATAVGLTFNSSVPASQVPTGFAERFIHSEILKNFPDVVSVVHAHSREVLPFANQPGVPLVGLMHTAACIGPYGAPVFDTRDLPASILPNNQLHDLLVRDQALGEALASTFSLDSQVVLMRGHGMAVRGSTIRNVVFRSYYIKEDAVVQYQSILLGGGTPPQILTAREAVDASTTADGLVSRAWPLWVQQVDGAGLYVNDLRNKGA